MKKIFSKIVSVFCCAALLFTLCTLAVPAQVSASAPQTTIHLFVEGKTETVFQQDVTLDSGKPAVDYLVAALKSIGLTQVTASGDADQSQWGSTFYLSESTYGALVSRIKNDATPSDWSETWSLYINGQSAMYGVSGLYPKDGDTIVLAYGDSATCYPTVAVTPQRPVKGQAVTVKVTATTITDYTTFATKTEPVAGAAVQIGGNTATTDANGIASLTAPGAAGNYAVSVGKEGTGGAVPSLVRTQTPLRVYDSLPAGDDGSGYSLVTDNTIDAAAAGSVSAKLDSAVSGDKKEATLNADKTVTLRNGDQVYSLALQGGTVISGPSSWDGSILLPQAVSPVSADNAVVKLSVQAGDSGLSLLLSKPARIVLPGMHGYSAGYSGPDKVFHRITTVLSSDSAPSNPGADYTAVYDNGSDLIIYTTHFTTFSAYNDLSSTASAEASCAATLKTDQSVWGAFALSRAGYSPAQGYLNTIKQRVEANRGNYPYSASLAADILALEAGGFNAADFCGVNLLEKLYNYSDIENTALSGLDYALLALDAKGTAMPADAVWTTQKLTDKIIGYQHSDGSFAYSPELSGDPDMTAMSITALAPHASKNAAAKTAVDKAVAWLASKQLPGGGFMSSFSSDVSSESISQVIVALCAAGIDPKYDSRFIKNGKNLLLVLLSYQTASGGFEHTIGGGANTIASEQALEALAAYARFADSKPALFDCKDVTSNTVVSADKQKSKENPVANPNTGSTGTPLNAAAVSLGACLVLLPLRKKLNEQ